MGFRFRRSVTLLPGVRLNFSKSGITTSLGGPGASINIGRRGTRKTIGLPGSGVSYSALSGHSSGMGSGASGPSASSSNQGCGCLLLGGLLLAAISTCSQDSKVSPKDLDGPSEAAPIGSTASGPGSFSYASDETVYVNTQTLNARSGPSSTSRIVGRLRDGQAVKVVESKGDWLKVAQGAALFWIANSHVTSSPPVRAAASQSLLSTPQKRTRSAKRTKSKRGNFLDGSCPCSGTRICIGPRGGRYCITSGGNKRYGV